MNLNQTIFIGLLVLISLILGIVSVIMASNNNKKIQAYSNLGKDLTNLQNSQNNLTSKINKDKSKVEVGPKGEKGDAGGVFIKSGPLRSIWANKNNVPAFLSRTAGTTQGTKLYLQSSQFFPEENWTLRSDGQLQSGKGGCVIITKDNEVSIGGCVDREGTKKTRWNFDQFGRLTSNQDDVKMCLAINTQPGNKITTSQIKNGVDTGVIELKNIRFARAEKCQENTNNIKSEHQFAFY
jgi:hypothetical protein